MKMLRITRRTTLRIAAVGLLTLKLCFAAPADLRDAARVVEKPPRPSTSATTLADSNSSIAIPRATMLRAALRTSDITSMLLLAPQVTSSSGGSFMKTVGTAGNDMPLSVRHTSDGGFVVSGTTHGVGAGAEDIFLIKFDSAGEIQWAKAYGGTGNEAGYSVQQTSDGGYIVAGNSDSFIGTGQVLLAKFDAAGTFVWATTGGFAADSSAGVSVQQTTDGGYVVSGFPFGAIGGLGLFKFDAAGQLQFLRRAAGTNVYGLSVQQTTDAGYIVSGNKQGNVYDATLLKFDAAGNLQWAQLAGGGAYDAGLAVQQTTDAGYVIGGITASFGAGDQDALLLKYDSSGNLQWARTAGGTGDDGADFVRQTSDGGYVLSGHTGSFGSTGLDAFLLKYDGSGTFQWAKAGGGSIMGTPTLMDQTIDGSYILAGSTNSSGAGGSDILLVRTDANGDVAGCSGWASVSPTIGSTFASNAASYGIDSPGFNMTARTLADAGILLSSNATCRVTTQVASLDPAQSWIGLKTSDDQGTQFDLRAELYKNATLIASGTTLCVTGVTRNPNLAKKVSVPFGPITDGDLASGDVLSLKLLTRIGTNPDGSKCVGPGGSHASATGLRLYYDSAARDSGFGAEITPDPMQSFYLHSLGSSFFFDSTQPTGTTPKTADSAGITFSGGNPWKEIGSWSRTIP